MEVVVKAKGGEKTKYHVFVQCFPGLEETLMDDIKKIRTKGGKVEIRRGGVEVTGANFRTLMKANVCSGVAQRALVKVGSWKCHDYTQLGKIVKGERERLKREFGIGRKNPKKLRFRISSSSSSLYHTVGIRDCILRGLGRTLEEFETEEEKEIGKRHEGEAIVARFNRNVLAISIDCSGSPLNERGWRKGMDGKAPLRETVASGMLTHLEWGEERSGEGEKEKGIVLVDPFCGSGTLCIEAAMRIRDGGPGKYMTENRGFKFKGWPGFEGADWASLLGDLGGRGGKDVGNVRILGYDRDKGVIKSAKENAEKAGVGNMIEFKQQSISELKNDFEGGEEVDGFIVTNPPWGDRVKGGAGGELRNLWGKFGHIVKGFQGWSLGVLSVDSKMVGHMGLGKGWSKIGVTYGGKEAAIWKKII